MGLSRNGSLPKRASAEMGLCRGSLPKWVSAETGLCRNGPLLKWVCAEAGLSRNGPQLKRALAETGLCRSGLLPNRAHPICWWKKLGAANGQEFPQALRPNGGEPFPTHSDPRGTPCTVVNRHTHTYTALKQPTETRSGPGIQIQRFHHLTPPPFPCPPHILGNTPAGRSAVHVSCARVRCLRHPEPGPGRRCSHLPPAGEATKPGCPTFSKYVAGPSATSWLAGD